MKGFIFAVTFILIFSALVATMPLGLQGYGSDADEINEINPLWQSGFQYNITWERTDFSYTAFFLYYSYNLGGYSWYHQYDDYEFSHYRKILIVGLWLGGLRTASFYNLDNVNRGTSLSHDEIEEDSDEGLTQYNMILGNGDSAGSLIFLYNKTLYTDNQDAWINGALYLMHGLGLDESAPLNVGQLLVQLLTLRVPNVPILIGVILASPLYACVVFMFWFIVKETLPFV